MSEDGLTVWSPVTMWLTIIDRLLEKLKEKIDISMITAVSGCGQASLLIIVDKHQVNDKSNDKMVVSL